MSLCRILTICYALAFTLLSITLAYHWNTRDPFHITIHIIHTCRTWMYDYGYATDRLSRPLLSHEALAFEDLLRIFPFRPNSTDTETLADIRRHVDILKHVLPSPMNCYMERTVARNVTVQWHIGGDHIENTTDARTIIYMHGGAYISGSLQSHQGFMCHLSQLSGIRVLGVEYRVAPEHLMPASIEDGYHAYAWLINEIRVKPAHVIFMGDSAGGGAVLLMAQHLINQKLTRFLPAGVVAISPWTDMTLSGESFTSNTHVDDTLSESQLLHIAREHAVGQDDKRLSYDDPLVSPLYGVYLDLPPLYIVAGSDELLFDDARRFVDRARDVRVDVHWSIGQYMEHGYVISGISFYPEAQQELYNIIRWMKTKLGLQPKK